MSENKTHNETSAVAEKSNRARATMAEPKSCRGTGTEIEARYNHCFHHLRFVVISAGGLAMGLMLFLRLSITVTMVSMVNHTQLYINEHPNATAEEIEEYFDADYREVGEFNWSNEIQEKIITFYMITYTIFPFYVTSLLMKHGLRIGVAVSLALCAVTNILTPIMSYWGWQWVLVLRLINGGAASGVVPGMINLIGAWTPSSESAKGVVIYQFTGNILAVLAPLLGGQLAAIHWKWAYYVPGTVALIFCLFWYVLISDGPDTSKLVSQRELDLIKGRSNKEDKIDPSCENSQAQVAEIDQEKASADLEVDKTTKVDKPLRTIFRISEFYYMAIIWSLYCTTSGGITYLLPAYLHRVLKVPVDQIGMLTFISQLGSLFSMLWPNQVADFLVSSCKFSLTSARTVVVFICVLMASISLLYIAYSHSYLVILICIHRFFHMTHDTVYLATVMSQFSESGLSGLVYSIVNSLGCGTLAIFCVLVGKFLDYTGETLECWSWIFVSITIMNVLYFFVYSAFCHSNPVKIKLSSSDV